MSLLTENNRQYYEGAQGFRGDGSAVSFITTFDTDLVFGAASNTDVNYALNNFKLYTSTNAVPGTWSEVTTGYTVIGNTITFTSAPADLLYIVVQLKKLDGGNYASTFQEKAYGDAVEKNYGSYSYVSLDDVINNFLVAYVGTDKLVTSVKRTDVVFHAKRGLQEFSYDTLKSVNKLEVTVPHNLSIPIPQDYVNYVNLYWIDNSGVKHVIMPGDGLTTKPTGVFADDNKGVPIQDSFDNSVETTSITNDRWKNNFTNNANNQDLLNDTILGLEYYNGYPEFGYGQLFGLDPQFANANGYFNIDERYNKFSFSSNLVDRIVVLEYISDGLATDKDTKIPKMAEEAIYAHILHAILASKINQNEYVIQRLKKERTAKLRNAKIRLSNIKLNEIVQVMRGKSKWIKH
jgi:hypothetical protein